MQIKNQEVLSGNIYTDSFNSMGYMKNNNFIRVPQNGLSRTKRLCKYKCYFMVYTGNQNENGMRIFIEGIQIQVVLYMETTSLCLDFDCNYRFLRFALEGAKMQIF